VIAPSPLAMPASNGKYGLSLDYSLKNCREIIHKNNLEACTSVWRSNGW